MGFFDEVKKRVPTSKKKFLDITHEGLGGGIKGKDPITKNFGENAFDTSRRVDALFNDPEGTFRHYRDNPKDLLNAYGDGLRAFADPFGLFEGIFDSGNTNPEGVDDPRSPSRADTIMGVLSMQKDRLRKKRLSGQLGTDAAANPDATTASSTLFGVY